MSLNRLPTGAQPKRFIPHSKISQAPGGTAHLIQKETLAPKVGTGSVTTNALLAYLSAGPSGPSTLSSSQSAPSTLNSPNASQSYSSSSSSPLSAAAALAFNRAPRPPPGGPDYVVLGGSGASDIPSPRRMLHPPAENHSGVQSHVTMSPLGLVGVSNQTEKPHVAPSSLSHSSSAISSGRQKKELLVHHSKPPSPLTSLLNNSTMSHTEAVQLRHQNAYLLSPTGHRVKEHPLKQHASIKPIETEDGLHSSKAGPTWQGGKLTSQPPGGFASIQIAAERSPQPPSRTSARPPPFGVDSLDALTTARSPSLTSPRTKSSIASTDVGMIALTSPRPACIQTSPTIHATHFKIDQPPSTPPHYQRKHYEVPSAKVTTRVVVPPPMAPLPPPPPAIPTQAALTILSWNNPAPAYEARPSARAYSNRSTIFS